MWPAVHEHVDQLPLLPGVADLLVKLPLFDQANRFRWSLATEFWLSILAAFGADLVARRQKAGGYRAAAVLILLSAALAVLLTQRVPARFSKINTALKAEHWRAVVQHPAVRSALAWR